YLVFLLGRSCIAKRQHAGIDEQPTIAIFGKAGQAIDIGDVDARPLQRLVASAVVNAGCRQQSPSAIPPSVSRDGQIGPSCCNSSVKIVGAGSFPLSASIASRSNRPPGRGVSR